jgi:hypothetical protein
MQDLNTRMKLKVLQNLKDHMNNRIGERMRPKQAAAIAEKAHNPEAPAEPSIPSAQPHGDFNDDDIRRLTEMYQGIKS